MTDLTFILVSVEQLILIKFGSRIKFSGFIDNAVISVDKLMNDEFAIVDLDGAGIEVGGDIAGSKISGSVFLPLPISMEMEESSKLAMMKQKLQILCFMGVYSNDYCWLWWI